MKIIGIENSSLEELRCAICKDYLICFPIRLCTDGQVVCGNCEVEDDKMFPPRRVPLLESILQKTTFSCKFKEYGCDEELSFDFVKEHELKCVYQPCTCIAKNCDWKGLLVKLITHFHDKHFVRVNKIEISPNWKDNFDDVLLGSIQNIPFIVKYKYCASTGILSYAISYIAACIQTASYKIFKNGDALTEGRSFLYNPSVSKADATYEKLNIANSYEGGLTIKITFVKYSWYIVDDSIVQFLVCLKCDGYLLPSAYDYQPFQFICGSCAENIQNTIVSTQPIIKIIEKAKFPCKWKYCNFVSTANVIYKHEKHVRFVLISAS